MVCRHLHFEVDQSKARILRSLTVTQVCYDITSVVPDWCSEEYKFTLQRLDYEMCRVHLNGKFQFGTEHIESSVSRSELKVISEC